MKRNISIIFITLLFTCTGFTQEENLVQDPSFEEITEFESEESTWRTLAFNEESSYSEFMIETGNAHTGNKFVTIINRKENHARFIQRVVVQPGNIYRLSCWAKTENVGTEAKGAIITEEGIIEHSPSVKGTSDAWVYTEMYIRIGKDLDSIVVAVSLGGYYGTNTGKASFDDVTVEEVEDIPRGAVVATKGEFVQEVIREEEQPVRIVKEPMPMNIPVVIAVILGITGIFFIAGRIIYMNVIKKKIPEKKENQEDKTDS